MKFNFNAMITSSTIVISVENKKNLINNTVVFTKSHLNFNKVSALLDDIVNSSLFIRKNKIDQDTYDQILELHDTTSLLDSWSNGLLSVSSGDVTYKGQPIPNDLSSFLIKIFIENPHDTSALSAWSKYLELVEKAGSNKTESRLFTFLSHNDLQISKEGKVLAWKAVRVHGENEDGSLALRDIYTGSMDNSVGQVVTMKRSKVDDNDGRTCSTGLHIASHEYAFGFAGRGDAIVQVEVDVTDIISVPTDYNGQKARTCRYEVKALVGIVGEDIHSKEDMLELAPIKGFATNVEDEEDFDY